MRLLKLTVLMFLPWLASCNQGGSGSSSAGGQSSSFGLSERRTVATLAFPRRAPRTVAVDAVPAFPGLSFESPVYFTSPRDGTNRLFVVEQAGVIRLFSNDASTTSAATFLDIRPRVNSGGEEGLLGLAFDPDFAVTGQFYVNYTASSPNRTVVARYRVLAFDSNRADPDSEEVIIEVDQPDSNHNAGMIEFGPDGFLYVALGDGGGAADPHGHGQDLSTLLGSLLRIDPRGGSPYAIPSDNPFVSTAGARGETWAYGFRNPWRFSFDRETGDLWLGDVGEGRREEIDLIEMGGNYGWSLFEGSIEFRNPSHTPIAGFKAPIAEYDHDLGKAIVGGYVYRGSRLLALRGAYVYGDFVTGRVWALRRQAGEVVSNEEIAVIEGLSSFGEDADGEIFAVSIAGSLFRFEEVEAEDYDFPRLLSETKLFRDTANLTPATGLIEYDVSSPFWSDGARKRRWIALPGREDITFNATDSWVFPERTAIVKHFDLDGAGPGGTARRIETRVLVLHREGWAGYTYRWNDAETDAELLDEATSADFTVADSDAPGGSRAQRWIFPGPAECKSCHTAAAGRILGLRTDSLNHVFEYPERADNQLRAWNHVGLFTVNIGSAPEYSSLTSPTDEGQSIERRARAYLHANCSQCHRPGGTAPGGMDLRDEAGEVEMDVVGVRPTGGDIDVLDAYRVTPGSKESSVLWERMRRLDGARMPPLASSEVDDFGVDLIGQWIDSLR